MQVQDRMEFFTDGITLEDAKKMQLIVVNPTIAQAGQYVLIISDCEDWLSQETNNLVNQIGTSQHVHLWVGQALLVTLSF